jgi:hypothetical protein
VRVFGVGGEATFGATGPTNGLALHESRDLVAATGQATTLRGLGELAPSIDAVVLLPERLQRWSEFLVSLRTRRGWARLGVVVRAGGDL